jgi:glutathione peroxidase-family protein
LLQDIDNRNLNLSKYKGKVVLVVNVASECGFTPQYKELAELYNKYSGQGLVVLGAPCNQFGGQEPGSDSEIKKFAQSKGAKFPLTAKLDVNGPNSTPLTVTECEPCPGRSLQHCRRHRLLPLPSPPGAHARTRNRSRSDGSYQ